MCAPDREERGWAVNHHGDNHSWGATSHSLFACSVCPVTRNNFFLNVKINLGSQINVCLDHTGRCCQVWEMSFLKPEPFGGHRKKEIVKRGNFMNFMIGNWVLFCTEKISHFGVDCGIRNYPQYLILVILIRVRSKLALKGRANWLFLRPCRLPETLSIERR